MPYRRLPNTDQARLRALRTAIRRAEEADYSEQVIQYRTLTEAQKFVMIFENQISQYKQNFSTTINANKQYRHVVANARMYISHFIQVLNLSVIRGEIKADQKTLYGLSPTNHILPELASEEDLLEWGEKIIQGEQARIKQGGFPIYNPTINKVKVFFDIFKENVTNQRLHRQTTARVTQDIDPLRKQADQLILQIWNEVEDYYKTKYPYARMCACQNYGVVYYYRRGESLLSTETDRKIALAEAASPKLNF